MRVGAIFASVAMVSLSVSPANAAAKPAPARDWSKTVVATPEGGFQMGNPAAKIRLIEYGSLACPHCRHFEETGYKPLVQNYVRTGKVSYEFRNLLLNGPDISVSLITRCAGAANFFPMSAVVFDTQPQWEDQIQKSMNALSDDEKAAIDKMTDQQRIVRFGELGGLTQLGIRFGVTPARARQCLGDPKALEKLLHMTETANKDGVDHTPTFIINGKVTDAALWEQLEPLLKKAGA